MDLLMYILLSVTSFINKKAVSIPGIKPGTTTNNVINNIQVLEKVLLCDGSGIADRHSSLCKGYVLPNQAHFKYNHVRCVPCKKLIAKNSRQQKKQLSQSVKAQVKRQKSRKTVKYEKAKNKRIKTKLVELKAEVARLKKNFAKANKAVVEKEISNLPQAQQEAVRACFSSAKVKSKGRRYTKQWIYECLLMRIKNRKLYEHLRSHEILALPHVDTVNKYVKYMGSTYEFSSIMFDMLRTKAEQMEPAEKRGILLADEMKLSEALKFDRDSCLFHGFVNLGDYTPESQEHELGDHALVFMYQPFRGSWVQAVACFLSKGCANSNVLQCLVLECIILLEKSEFLCDGVTTDGATWN
ncbi:uncharacterized protein LOC112461873 [Temnothorax curvispinosus]|uniref:Uncharacterized protein LOC112461873 n=1 Tax=Temnothorax curvispinosus TaxID=300111 RepID=A0A6J1QKU0_9HYME|nr:uncharacterized protein LOC112461873 [Temnothorax curvispinosus]